MVDVEPIEPITNGSAKPIIEGEDTEEDVSALHVELTEMYHTSTLIRFFVGNSTHETEGS